MLVPPAKPAVSVLLALDAEFQQDRLFAPRARNPELTLVGLEVFDVDHPIRQRRAAGFHGDRKVHGLLALLDKLDGSRVKAELVVVLVALVHLNLFARAGREVRWASGSHEVQHHRAVVLRGEAPQVFVYGPLAGARTQVKHGTALPHERHEPLLIEITGLICICHHPHRVAGISGDPVEHPRGQDGGFTKLGGEL